jgi:hypothetical protein
MMASVRTVNTAGLGPKKTLVAPVKPVPVRVTLLPPAIGPVVGLRLVRVGVATYMNVAPLLMAAALLTVTELAPTDPLGEMAVTELSEFTVKDAAGLGPKKTAVALVNPVPLMVTDVPPVRGPELGVMELTTGVGWKVKSSELLVPPGVVILMGTVPIR